MESKKINVRTQTVAYSKESEETESKNPDPIPPTVSDGPDYATIHSTRQDERDDTQCTPSTQHSFSISKLTDELTGINSNASPRFLTSADILDPKDLASLPSDQYVLLAHNPKEGVGEIINQDGLRSTKDLGAHENAAQEFKDTYNNRATQNYFGNDPSLIYFRPVTTHTQYKVLNRHIVIAVKAEALFVYDQENRVRGDKSDHAGSAMSIRAYENAMQQKPAGTYLSRYKTHVTWDKAALIKEYFPECCVQADKIPPNLFVPHAGIDKGLLDTPSPNFRDLFDKKSSSELALPQDAVANVPTGTDDIPFPTWRSDNLHQWSDRSISLINVSIAMDDVSFSARQSVNPSVLPGSSISPMNVLAKELVGQSSATNIAAAGELGEGVMEKLASGSKVHFSSDISGYIGGDQKTIYLTVNQKDVKIILPNSGEGKLEIQEGDILSGFTEPSSEVLRALENAGVIRLAT
jgi:hypothetical protein